VVHLKDFSLVSPDIQTGDLLEAIEMAVPAFAIEQAITNTQKQEERKRALPAQLALCCHCDERIIEEKRRKYFREYDRAAKRCKNSQIRR
jgi:hypothetical protein